jgi:hypothetical protein
VLSFVVASLLTTIASIAAAVLDAAVADPMALLPLWLQNWLNRGLSTQQIDNRKLWRRVLDRLILAFADQQLITGFALLVSGYVNVGIHKVTGIMRVVLIILFSLLLIPSIIVSPDLMSKNRASCANIFSPQLCCFLARLHLTNVVL